MEAQEHGLQVVRYLRHLRMAQQAHGALQRGAQYVRRVAQHRRSLQSGLVDYVFSTSAKGRDPKRDSVRLRRKAVELSIPCITAVDTANALVDCLRSDHSLENIPLVDIATLYHRK